ncbi:hypothetical protein QR680_011469 [Steinernema hermaphroditum]|uniref:BTB domain-containing protein n=1 Tax=Steinernema hermaphroditum TaxID=289476 RepID=A0AA39I114_9BILA|nr:hypothetical protein QR680_011469 [Steinernema hermaphroditum]
MSSGPVRLQQEVQGQDQEDNPKWETVNNIKVLLAAKFNANKELEYGLQLTEEKRTLCWTDVHCSISITQQVNRSLMPHQPRYVEDNLYEGEKCIMIAQDSRMLGTLVCKNQGVITVTVDVTIRRQKKFALDQFVEGMADLKIELDLGMELFVSKLFLCAHSAVFSNMMNSTFVEGQTGVCKLPGVKYHIFMIVLHRFYGFPIDFENLNDDDLTDVIEFANRFQFDLLLTEIENYLMSLNATKRRKWFDVAEHYTLIALLNSILKTMTFCEVQTLYHKAKSEGFGNLNQKYSNETVDAILGRLCSNNPNNYEWNS